MPSYKNIDSYLGQIKSDSSKVLELSIGSHKNVPFGAKIPKADAQSPPTLKLPPSLVDSNKKYILVAIDIDAPFPSWRGLGPILHWVQPGFKHDPETGNLTTSEPFITNYIGPAPPPPSSPHRYCFFLYEQPESLVVSEHAPKGGKKVGNAARMWFDLEGYESKIGLKGGIVAGNWFVSN
ncbi:putative phosphatidylethanolamine-binding protein [Talaromyces proteolyticus]|uniref:Phosphatidylethanolamine-binding protein n=1 Tax=Talaromyces proteolyticus TaxID=1131652 RepID=A0AAD4KX30_9EURO|nr:putative phosphatidylethanolamine-binding protein [Talaromyces proteolyticus]KAH8697884.1 putative phosphatidylethanolamine-binding protein [Talaromyces proteolyticus]